MHTAEHADGSLQNNTFRILGHQDHGELLVARRIRIGLAHDDKNLTQRIEGVGSEPFTAINDVFVAVLDNGGFQIARVRGGDGRLRH